MASHAVTYDGAIDGVYGSRASTTHDDIEGPEADPREARWHGSVSQPEEHRHGVDEMGVA